MRALFFIFILLFFPLLGFGFSETELDSLESTGKKSFSSSPWRIQLSFSLQRNMEFNSFQTDRGEENINAREKNTNTEETLIDTFKNLFNPSHDTSLLDFSNLYYILGLNLNYSIAEIAKNLKYDFLKNTELFLNSSFDSPFKGYNHTLKDYGPGKYIHYALGDITGGFTVPTYKKGSFFSDFSLFFMPYRLSRFSKEAGLLTAVGGGISLLYFLKKEQKWNLSLSSGHNLTYRYYTKPVADKDGSRYNVPWSTSQSGSFIFRQSYNNKYLPSNIRFSVIHFFGINTFDSRFQEPEDERPTVSHFPTRYNSWVQDLTLTVTSSWKIKDRTYINFSIRWKDRIHNYNPYRENIRKTESIRLFSLNKYILSFGGSYSF